MPGPVPTLHGLDHMALTVPDLDQAVAFFSEVIGCELLYRHGPYQYPEGTPDEENYFVRYLGQDGRSRTEIAVLRCGNGSNLELFETDGPGSVKRVPQFVDVGSTHLSFYVDDMEAAVETLRAHGLEVFGGIATAEGPEAGERSTNCHFLAPWGQMLELVSYPSGRAYEAETQGRLWQPNKPDTWLDPS
jgi:catechol 2,3-dioxygenase-like lactoylglutathione lyase family enzyme